MTKKELLDLLKYVDDDKEVRVCLEGKITSYKIIDVDFNSNDVEVYLEFTTDK